MDGTASFSGFFYSFTNDNTLEERGSVRNFAHISLDGDCCLPKTHLSLKCLRNRALTYFFRFRFPAGVCTILVI